MNIRLFSIELLSVLITACTQSRIEIVDIGTNSKTVAQEVSLRALAKAPGKFNGTFVAVRGKFYNHFEDVALYDDGFFPDKKVRFWLNFTESIIKDGHLLDQLSGKSVVVKGKVNATQKGHFNWYVAELDSVYFIRQD